MKITLNVATKELADRLEAALAHAGLHVVRRGPDSDVCDVVETPRVIGLADKWSTEFMVLHYGARPAVFNQTRPPPTTADILDADFSDIEARVLALYEPLE